MSDQDAFERILASLYDAMLDDIHWSATSALIDEACGIQGNALLVGEGPKDAIRPLFVGLYYRGQRREDWEREYLTVYHPIAEHVPRFRQLPDSHVVHLTELYTAEEMKTSRTYNEALPQGNARDSLIVRLDASDDSFISWSPLDPVTRGGWGASQLALIKGLLPHIRQFVRVRQALVKADALGTSVPDLLDNTRVGVIHLDRRGRIVEVNDRARAVLRHGDGVVDQGGTLHAREPADHARLEQLIADALPTAGAASRSGSMTLRRAAGMASFVVHITPVGGRQADFGAAHVAALVLLIEPGRQSRLDPGLVAATLGLTLTEGQIAIWLAEGRSVQEIAVATARTPNAIRWHLKQIYRKQGLAGQPDLVRLVLSLSTWP